jgi:hypothetical protein
MEFASGARESGKKRSFMVLSAKAAIVDAINTTPGQKQFNLQAERLGLIPHLKSNETKPFYSLCIH